MNYSCSLLVSEGGPWPLVIPYYNPEDCIPFTFLITILCHLNKKKTCTWLVLSGEVLWSVLEKDKGHCACVKNYLRKVLYLSCFYYYLQLSGKCINFFLLYFLFSPRGRRQNLVLSLGVLKLVLLTHVYWLGWISSRIVSGTHYLGHDGDFASALAFAQ